LGRSIKRAVVAVKRRDQPQESFAGSIARSSDGLIAEGIVGLTIAQQFAISGWAASATPKNSCTAGVNPINQGAVWR